MPLWPVGLQRLVLRPPPLLMNQWCHCIHLQLDPEQRCSLSRLEEPCPTLWLCQQLWDNTVQHWPTWSIGLIVLTPVPGCRGRHMRGTELTVMFVSSWALCYNMARRDWVRKNDLLHSQRRYVAWNIILSDWIKPPLNPLAQWHRPSSDLGAD